MTNQNIDTYARAVRRNIAANARHYRLARHLTRLELAEKYRIGEGFFEQAENPDGPLLTVRTLVRLALMLDIPLVELFTERELPQLQRGRRA